jgi:hypothetical protein
MDRAKGNGILHDKLESQYQKINTTSAKARVNPQFSPRNCKYQSIYPSEILK